MSGSAPDGCAFQCTGCGACCTGNDAEHYVLLEAGEEQALRRFLGVSRERLRAHYLTRLDPARRGIRLEGGACVFLDGERRCRVYPVRPAQCRTYPYWPEITASREAWAAEGERCEGMKCGVDRNS